MLGGLFVKAIAHFGFQIFYVTLKIIDLFQRLILFVQFFD
jgi:hypothetical protein